MTTSVRFEKVVRRRSLIGTCPNCHCYVQRRRTFEQTVAEFNTNPDGTPKSREQVAAEVTAEANAWAPDFIHEKCRSVAQ